MTDPISGIYSITRPDAGHRYIGSAVDFARRWGIHRRLLRLNSHHSRHLQSAWNKYGEAAFRFEVLEECAIPQLIEREQWWIDTAQPEYNISPTAGSSLGIKRTEGTRRKIGDVSRGRPKSLETIRKISEALKGRKKPPRTPEHLRRMGESKKGKHLTEEHRRKIGLAQKGRKHAPFTKETIQKLSESHKGKSPSEDTRRKLSEALMGHPVSAETRRLISVARQAAEASK